MKNILALIMLSQLLMAQGFQIDTLGFPEFHQEYFKSKFWNRSEKLEHPFLELRNINSISKLDSLLKKDSLSNDFEDALWVYNFSKNSSYSDSINELLLAKFEKTSNGFWKSRMLLEIAGFLARNTKSDSLIKFLKNNNDLEKYLGYTQRQEFRRLELEHFVSKKDEKVLNRNWARYVGIAKNYERELLKPFIFTKVLPFSKDLAWDDFETLIEYLNDIKEKKQALSLVEAYPGSNQKKSSDILSYYKLLGSSRESTNDFKGAISAFEKALSLENRKNYRITLIDKIIRAYDDLKDQKKVDSLRYVLEDLNPKSSKVASQLWLKAFELEQKEKYDEAKEVYLKLDKNYPGDKRQTWASFRAGLSDYKAGRFEKAREQFDRALNDDLNLFPRSACLYYRALSYEKLNQDSLALAALYETIRDYPLGYFAWRARQKLYSKKIPLDEIPTIATFESSRDSIWIWLEGDKEKVPEKDSLLIPLEKILAAGAWHWVEPFLREKSNWTSIDWVDFGILFDRYGYLAQSYSFGRKLLNKIPRAKMNYFPVTLAKLMYPQPYPQEVKGYLKDSKLEPEFIWALMRQESIFNDQISSPVGAAGLMQIMDYTGKDLALAESLKTFEARWLKNPLYAMRLGIRYLKDLYVEYENTVWVLTNYNAGPTPTRRWINETEGKEHDVALDDISYWETRDYVKKVTSNYYNFKIINTNDLESILKMDVEVNKVDSLKINKSLKPKAVKP